MKSGYGLHTKFQLFKFLRFLFLRFGRGSQKSRKFGPRENFPLYGIYAHLVSVLVSRQNYGRL